MCTFRDDANMMYVWEGLKNITPKSYPSLSGVPVQSVTLSHYYGNLTCHKCGKQAQKSDGYPGDESDKCIGCHGNHGVILTRCGRVFTFGDNIYGQLGVGDLEHRGDEPLLVELLKGIIQFTCILRDFSFI